MMVMGKKKKKRFFMVSRFYINMEVVGMWEYGRGVIVL